MRTRTEIKSIMTDAFIADPTIIALYELESGKTFDEQFSAVSIESILFNIVAMAILSLDWLFDTFKQFVEERVLAAIPGTVAWMYNLAMSFEYNGVQIIKYCAITEAYDLVNIKVQGESFQPLTVDQLEAFNSFMMKNRFAGVRIHCSSIQSDDLALTLRVWRNPLLLNESKQISAESAVKNYLNSIKYGGVFNKTKLIDAVQQVAGVEDVTIESCVFTAHDSNGTITDLEGQQNYTAISGHIALDALNIEFIIHE